VRETIIAILVLAGLGLGPALAQDVPTPLPRPKVTAPAKAAPPAATGPTATRPAAEGHGQVFLLRGLVNVFSLGMDTLARKIRAKDIPVRVTNFMNWRGYAAVLVDLYRSDKSLAPVVIMGHSLGADAAIDMGNYLAENGVPVRLVVAFDGVHGGHTASPGIAEVINYYKADGVGQTVAAAPGFKGKLTNVDLSDRTEIDHLNIEKSPALHAEVVARLVSIFGDAGD
jgi:pimeloyl-ACP methyl ester carboxylesterase